MAKKFAELRDRMIPEARARSERKASAMLAEMAPLEDQSDKSLRGRLSRLQAGEQLQQPDRLPGLITFALRERHQHAGRFELSQTLVDLRL